MTERPYTDDDLRTEAAAQHAALLRDPDFMGIGEQMDDETWRSLGPDDFEAAQRAVDDLLTNAADVSEWAIDLGADGLQPSDEHAITVDADGKPIARIHFAFEPGMPDEMRAALVEGIGAAIAQHLPAEPAATGQPDACGKCRRPFNPADPRWDGSARHQDTPFCRSCVDACHESTDAFHQCAICR